MQIIILLFSFFCGVQFCYAQGNYGNATNNSNTGNTSTLFEINTNSNSNSAMPSIQDTIQFNINDEGDDEMEKREESIKIKSKEKSQIGFNKSINKDGDLESINKIFSPEFRNRLDSIVQFNILNKDTVKKIVEKFFIFRISCSSWCLEPMGYRYFIKCYASIISIRNTDSKLNRWLFNRFNDGRVRFV